jgi:hypothetical protein
MPRAVRIVIPDVKHHVTQLGKLKKNMIRLVNR